jgi:hypothetical protein
MHACPAFIRLDAPLPRLPRWAGQVLRYRYGKEVEGRFHGVSYFAVEGPLHDALVGVLPEPLRPRFLCSYMVINHHDIPPHVDNGIRLSLNWYVVAGGATTHFYRLANPAAPVEHLQNNDPGSASGLYRLQDLEPVGSFTAGEQELWALDVTQPHAVLGGTPGVLREAYCLQSRTVGMAEFLGALGA